MLYKRHNRELDDAIADTLLRSEYWEIKKDYAPWYKFQFRQYEIVPMHDNYDVEMLIRAIAEQEDLMGFTAVMAHSQECDGLSCSQDSPCVEWQPDKIVSEPYKVLIRHRGY